MSLHSSKGVSVAEIESSLGPGGLELEWLSVRPTKGRLGELVERRHRFRPSLHRPLLLLLLMMRRYKKR